MAGPMILGPSLEWRLRLTDGAEARFLCTRATYLVGEQGRGRISGYAFGPSSLTDFGVTQPLIHPVLLFHPNPSCGVPWSPMERL